MKYFNLLLLSFGRFFAGVILAFLLIDTFTTGKLFNLFRVQDQRIFINKPFPTSPRYPSSNSINDIVQSIFLQAQYFHDLKKLQDLPYDVHFSLMPSNFTGNNATFGNSAHLSMNTSLIILKNLAKKNQEKTPIIIATHIDSSRYSYKDYNSMVYIEAIFDAIEKIIKQKVPIDRTVYFVFLGSEDFGQMGAMFVSGFLIKEAYYIILSGFGAGRPFTVLTKGKIASDVIRTLSKVNGFAINTALNEFREFHQSQKSSKAFDSRPGLRGVGCSFIGNPSVHNTPQDNFNTTLVDSKYLGSILYQFVLKFKEGEEDNDLVAFGVAPVVFIASPSFLKRIVYTLLLFGIISFFYKFKYSKFDYLPFLQTFCFSSFRVFLTYSVFTYFVIFFNTGSYINYYIIYTFLLMTSLFCLYFERHQKKGDFGEKEDWLFIQFLFYFILIFKFKNSEFVVPFLLPFLLSTVSFIIPNINEIVHQIMFFLSISPIIFAYSISFKSFSIYCQSLSFYYSDAYPLLIIYMFSMCIFISTMTASFSCSILDISMRNMNISYNIFQYFPYIVFVFFVFKPCSFSERYPITGSLTQYIYQNNRSMISFTPIAGKRIIRTIYASMRNASDIEYKPFYRGEQVSLKSPSFIREYETFELPLFFTQWPRISTVEEEKNLTHRAFYLNIDDISPSIDMIEIRIKCPNGPCVNDVLMARPKHIFTEEKKYIMVLKIINFYSPFAWKITLNVTEEVDASFLFTSNSETKEIIDFRLSLPAFVQPVQDERYMQSTVFVIKRMI